MIPINDCAIPPPLKVDPFVQTTLDSLMSSKSPIPAFTSAGLLDYIIKLIVSEDDICMFMFFDLRLL